MTYAPLKRPKHTTTKVETRGLAKGSAPRPHTGVGPDPLCTAFKHHRIPDVDPPAVAEISPERDSSPNSEPAPTTVPLQAKLAVGAANDPLEHEADRIAESVLADLQPLPSAVTTADDNSQIRHTFTKSRSQNPVHANTVLSAITADASRQKAR